MYLFQSVSHQAMEDEVFTLATTPEMRQRLTQLSKDVLKLIQGRTNTPLEAFIPLDAARRQLELTHNMVLVAPIDISQIGST